VAPRMCSEGLLTLVEHGVFVVLNEL
jgi:hypothetical protein